MTRDTPRLIEYTFPLKQTSLDSVHEKKEIGQAARGGGIP